MQRYILLWLIHVHVPLIINTPPNNCNQSKNHITFFHLSPHWLCHYNLWFNLAYEKFLPNPGKLQKVKHFQIIPFRLNDNTSNGQKEICSNILGYFSHNLTHH